MDSTNKAIDRPLTEQMFSLPLFYKIVNQIRLLLSPCLGKRFDKFTEWDFSEVLRLKFGFVCNILLATKIGGVH